MAHPIYQYTPIRESDFGGGIDQQSAESKIPEGYVEDALNADPKSTGHISKRAGYQGYAGNIPVRVFSIQYTDDLINNIILTLDSNIRLPSASMPLIIKGKSNSAVGDFPTTGDIKYYPTSDSEIRSVFNTGANTLSIPQSIHGISSPYIQVGISTSSTQLNTNNDIVFPDIIRVNKTTYDIEVDYVNNTGSSFTGFIYYKDSSAVAGTTFVQGANTVSTGANLFTITAGTHLLDTNNILVTVLKDTGTMYETVRPDNIYLDPTSGQVQVSLTNNTGSSFTGIFVLTSVPFVNVSTGSVASGATQTLTVPADTDFAFVSCYLETTIGGSLEQIIPDSISVDTLNNNLLITFTNNMSAGANFEVYWEFADIAANRIRVSGTVISTGDMYTDTSPELTVWGLDHSSLYKTAEAREGWATYIDSYRAEGQNSLITGLGGNIFQAGPLLSQTLYPNINSRVDSDLVIGPAFYDTADTPNRTRGYITGDTGGSNTFSIDSVTYNSGTGYVEYLLNIPNMAINGTLSTIISVNDKLTVSQCGYAYYNGTFAIKTVTAGVDSLIIAVSIPEITSDDYNETDSGGFAGIFTDKITLINDSPFLTDDLITSELFPSTDLITVSSTISNVVYLSNVNNLISVPGGLRVLGSRTSNILPLRTDINNKSVINLVSGDIISYSGITRMLRIKSINTNDDINVSITGNGTEAVITLLSGDTNNIYAGLSTLISQSINLSGVHSIIDVIDSTSFTVSSSFIGTETGVLVGKVIEIDEELSFSDNINNLNYINVPERWIPIEKPSDTYDITPSSVVRYFDKNSYINQDIIRSVMAQDSLFLTNNTDDIFKFDGANIYRAGLFRWQSGLFVTTNTSASGKIVTNNPSETYDTISGSQFLFTTTPENVLSFKVGDEIQDSQDNKSYIVTNTEVLSDSTGIATKGILSVNRNISGSSGTKAVTLVSNYKYYFRLNMIDSNNNIIASAATGSEDYVIKLAQNAAVSIKMVGMPAFGIYDYNRLEVQVYRTKANQPAPFYKLTTLQMPFNSDDGYISYTDTEADDTLQDLDEVNTALKGAELGTAWSEPLRAQHITSSGNRLILANVKDYPEVNLRLIKTNTDLTQAVLLTTGNRLWQLKKDNNDTGTGTDMINRARYEFTSSAVTVVGISGTAGVSFNVNVIAHGLSAGDWVYLYHPAVADGNNLLYSGWWQVASVPGVDNFVINNSDSTAGAAVNFPTKLAKATISSDIPVFLGTDGNYGMFNGNRTSTESYEFLAARRLADAVNVTMRTTDITISGQSGFAPWVTAAAGNEYNSGQVIFRQPKTLSTIFELTLPALSGDFDVFVNNVKRSGNEQVSALIRLFPSRIIASYPNFPEIFDSPFALVDSDSDSAIDVNPADGQEITGIIPFFGQSAFGAALNSGVIVVFKTNSIYVVDLAAKAQGINPVQRLETAGKGCTVPRSIAMTRNGIMFANESGIFRLTRSLEIDYVGRKYERKWRKDVNKNLLDLFTGHNDTINNNYKLSYASSSDSVNDKVAVYYHDREYEQLGKGSFSTYDNYPATGWANLPENEFFSSITGRVFQTRKAGDNTDFRDDSAAINCFILLRAIDHGASGSRKTYGKIISHFRTTDKDIQGTEITGIINLNTVDQVTDRLVIKGPPEVTGISDLGYNKLLSVVSVIKNKNGIYIQLRYVNNNIDEPLELVGVDIVVALRTSDGITKAAQTT